ncbi:hypothetical protein Xkoz_01921 [Xenorhabdus kozodoii]|uniref:Uncharacterized protein n=1 Tax=Xenorhabdus kozodoii TaxID=351676 RepID=A0A2D0LD37_9GAMM|nr:hypothetical protein Xkoz_01921 [Xenorhabdus kozodoii]
MLAELLAQCRRHQFNPVLWPQVGDQSFLVGFVLTGDHHRLAHPVTLGQSGFDFPQLDTEAAQLDLKIIAAKVVDIAVGQPAAEVAGFVHPGARLRGKGIGKETFGGQFRAVQVTAGDTGSADVNFPRDTKWDRLALWIQDINPAIGDRAANWRRIIASHTGVERGTDRDFRWPIGIEHFPP